MKTRIEVNEEGQFYMLLPEQIVEDYMLDDGDVVEWDDDGELVILTFS